MAAIDRPTALAYALFGAVIILWGSNSAVIKLGLEWMPPFWFGACRMGLGTLVVTGVAIVMNRLHCPDLRDLPAVLSVGLLQMALPTALINMGLLYVEAGRSTVLAFSTPLWVAPVAVLLFGESMTIIKAAGIALGLLGLGVLFNPAAFEWTDTDVVIGNALVMAASVVWAGAILHIRFHRWVSSPLALAPWQMLLATAVLGVLATTTEPIDQIQWTMPLAWTLAFNGVLASGFGFWAAVTVARALPAISTSVGFLGTPVTGVLVAAVALGEPITPTLSGGLVLIIAGIAFVSLPIRSRTAARSSESQ